MDPRQVLGPTLALLTSDQFKCFKLQLINVKDIPWARLQYLNQRETVDLLLQLPPLQALDVSTKYLKRINRNDLAEVIRDFKERQENQIHQIPGPWVLVRALTTWINSMQHLVPCFQWSVEEQAHLDLPIQECGFGAGAVREDDREEGNEERLFILDHLDPEYRLR